MEKKQAAYIYDELIKAIRVKNNNTSNELLFHKSELEREHLHSTGSKSFFGTRVPPQETLTLLNILKLLSDKVSLPQSFLSKL